ncbi:hypothetical protein PPERSA_01858 [Pseudocohnilembus persalinus]|uniref:Uncharacterized protein n=1 Tax=Pseudocohnilembus persalinus TaxID=266149 RepID=A0A0V0R2I3_PSEPJ|nr:hypothetical protein PPERSA_01858 [Pseudocohnilembus persalinus]|eukprot:KRX08605.1 hypothetical protein PPERSA_01858 [Pseudocohnilembus persalinus]
MADTQLQNSSEKTPQPNESEIQEKFNQENLKTQEEEQELKQKDQLSESEKQLQDPSKEQEIEQQQNETNQQTSQENENVQKEEKLDANQQDQLKQEESNQDQQQQNVEQLEDKQKDQQEDEQQQQEEKQQHTEFKQQGEYQQQEEQQQQELQQQQEEKQEQLQQEVQQEQQEQQQENEQKEVQQEQQQENKEEKNEENFQKLEKSNEVIIEDEKPKEQKVDESLTSQERLAQTTMQKARELLDKSEKLKNEAKIFIQQKYYAKALEIYQAALNSIHPNFFQNIPDKEILQKFKTLYNMLLNNCAFVHFQQKNYMYAIELCKSVKVSDPTNIKAYYRTSLCYKELEDYEKAFQEIKKARQIQNTSEVNQLYLEIKDLYKQYLDKNKDKERLLYSKMISQDKKKSQTDSNSSSNNNNNNNLAMSKSIFEKMPQNNQKTWVTLMVSSVLGLCIPTALGANLDNFGEIAGSVGLATSIFGGIRFQGNVYKASFATMAAFIVGLFYKFNYKKAIKN